MCLGGGGGGGGIQNVSTGVTVLPCKYIFCFGHILLHVHIRPAWLHIGPNHISDRSVVYQTSLIGCQTGLCTMSSWLSGQLYGLHIRPAI